MESTKLTIIFASCVLLICIGLTVYFYRSGNGNAGTYLSIFGIAVGVIICVISSQEALEQLRNFPYFAKNNSVEPSSIAYIDNVDMDVSESPAIINKDNIFIVQLFVRKEGSKDWQKEIEAKIGDVIEFQAEYRNSTGDLNPIMVRDVLPINIDYIEDSTTLYNSNYPKGVNVIYNTIHMSGIDIGSYQKFANAYVRFKAVVVDKTLATGNNKLVNWITVTSNGEALYDEADVFVTK